MSACEVPVEGRDCSAETFLGRSCECGYLTSPAPSSSASQVAGASGGVTVLCPPVLDIAGLAGAGYPLGDLLASYERMYVAYCAASSGQPVVTPGRRSRARRRGSKSSGASSVASLVSQASVPAVRCDFQAVSDAVTGRGDGYCYLWWFTPEYVDRVAEMVGANPCMSQLMSLPWGWWRPPGELQSLGIREVRDGVFHVFLDPGRGDIRGMTFFRSYTGKGSWVDSCGYTPCRVPGVGPGTVVGASELSKDTVVRSVPVAVYDGKPVFRGCVQGANPTGQVVQFSSSSKQLVGMSTVGRAWWALNDGDAWAATSIVAFQTSRKLPVVMGVPTEAWEGYSYLAMVPLQSRDLVVAQLGRSPTVAQMVGLPVVAVDLGIFQRMSFSCGERGLTLWLPDAGQEPEVRFSDLVAFSARTSVPVLGTLGAHLVSREYTDLEFAAADVYSRWVTRQNCDRVGVFEKRMPFLPSTARLV